MRSSCRQDCSFDRFQSQSSFLPNNVPSMSAPYMEDCIVGPSRFQNFRSSVSMEYWLLWLWLCWWLCFGACVRCSGGCRRHRPCPCPCCSCNPSFVSFVVVVVVVGVGIRGTTGSVDVVEDQPRVGIDQGFRSVAIVAAAVGIIVIITIVIITIAVVIVVVVRIVAASWFEDRFVQCSIDRFECFGGVRCDGRNEFTKVFFQCSPHCFAVFCCVVLRYAVLCYKVLLVLAV
mmetsp:Transcript_13455/g.27635  ORF Transcript_13455/g.27635 Transcript_13455/m.27635 type:complete len:231 (-) Transcript_13455:293-985(-)